MTAYNSLSGTIPTEIGNLKKLEYLNFRKFSNKRFVTGAPLLPSSFLKYDILETDICSTSSSAAIVTHICHTTLVQTTEMNYNLEGTIPHEIGLLSDNNMNYFDLQNNEFTGQIPTAIASLTNLMQLFLSKFIGFAATTLM